MYKRERWIDIAKGIAIIAVVIGHVIGGLQNARVIPEEDMISDILIFVIYKFHMPLFLFLSGYCYKVGGGKKILTMKEYTAYCKKHIINLGVPYIIFSIVYVLMNIAIAKTLGGINTAFEIKDIIQIWYKPVAQYWFLYVLLGLKLLTPIAVNVFSKEVLYILCVVAEFVYRTFVEDSYSLQGMFLYLIGYSSYYCLGLLCGSRKRIWMEFIEHRIVAIGCIAVADLILNWTLLEKVTSGVNVINNQLIAVCLIAIATYISNKMKQNGWLGKLFERCGKYSIYIFALHVFPCAFCRIIMTKMGIESALVQTLGATFVGIYTCLAVAKIAEKIPIINMMFYPQKGYEKIKSGAMK